MRLIRTLTGILLLPCCAAVTRTFFFILSFGWAEADRLPSPPVLALVGGLLFWALCFFFLPRPMRAYVLAHELSHALWGAALGARISGMRVSGCGGYVKLSDRNVVSVLAPYFFPFYTVFLIILYYLSSVFLDLRWLHLPWLVMIGATLGFHVFFTVNALSSRQSDILIYGRIFSYSLIYILCITEIAALVAVVTPGITIEIFAGRFAADMAWIWSWCWSGLGWALEALRSFMLALYNKLQYLSFNQL